MTTLSLDLPQSGPIAQSLNIVWQKGGHILLFGVLGLLAAGEPDPFRHRLLLAAGCVICLVAEFSQVLTETRHFTVTDVLTNLIAFGSAAALFEVCFRNGGKR